MPRLRLGCRPYLSKEQDLPQYRVIDVRSCTIEPQHMVEARSPEEAALRSLGEHVVRGGQSRNRLVCRVYWIHERQTNMVRLYRPL